MLVQSVARSKIAMPDVPAVKRDLRPRFRDRRLDVRKKAEAKFVACDLEDLHVLRYAVDPGGQQFGALGKISQPFHLVIGPQHRLPFRQTLRPKSDYQASVGFANGTASFQLFTMSVYREIECCKLFPQPGACGTGKTQCGPLPGGGIIEHERLILIIDDFQRAEQYLLGPGIRLIISGFPELLLDEPVRVRVPRTLRPFFDG